MKTIRNLGLIAVCTLALATRVNGQDAEGKVKVGDAEGKAQINLPESDRDRIAKGDQSEHRWMVNKVNKASGLVGMAVKNQQNEKLGDIQDVVLDLENGKVSYVVLSVGGFLGIGEKWIAVPPSAFTVAPDQDSLVLNADKARIQAAPGFVKTSWPSLGQEIEGAFWWNEAVGAADVSVRTGTATDRRDERSRLDRSRADRDAFRGKITAVDVDDRTITVSGDNDERKFRLAERPALTLKDNRNPSLSDFKVGYPVAVGFHKEGDDYVAHSIIRTDAPEVK